MDFLSDTAKKERRNLLGASFAGIVISWLRIYPAEIDLFGLKFHSSDLAKTVIIALIAVIAYFLVRFTLSYIFEQAGNELERISLKIRDETTSIDIVRVEHELRDLMREIEEKTTLINAQVEHEQNRLAMAEEKLRVDLDANHKSSLDNLNCEMAELINRRQELENRKTDAANVRPELKNIVAMLGSVDLRRSELETRRKDELRITLRDVDNERANILKMYEVTAKEVRQKWEEAGAKALFVKEWRRAHKTSSNIMPLHWFFEFPFPLLFALISIACLAWLGFHPPESKPISLPDF